jgi:hypothetical protein
MRALSVDEFSDAVDDIVGVLFGRRDQPFLLSAAVQGLDVTYATLLEAIEVGLRNRYSGATLGATLATRST